MEGKDEMDVAPIIPNTIRSIFYSMEKVYNKFIHSILETYDKSGPFIQIIVMQGPWLKLVETVHRSPGAYFKQYLPDSTLEKFLDVASFFQSQSEIFDPISETVINSDEADTCQALNQVYQFDLQDMDRPNQNSTSHSGNLNIDDLSFDPGSIATMGPGANKKVRFEQAFNNLYGPQVSAAIQQVPGPPSEMTGEQP
jgi:hypothetical protein